MMKKTMKVDRELTLRKNLYNKDLYGDVAKRLGQERSVIKTKIYWLLYSPEGFKLNVIMGTMIHEQQVDALVGYFRKKG